MTLLTTHPVSAAQGARSVRQAGPVQLAVASSARQPPVVLAAAPGVSTEMHHVDANPTTPFDFSLARYNAQLVAGYSQSTSTLGLVVHMPDLRSLARTGRAPANAPTHARATTR